jgi:hypothetical protein
MPETMSVERRKVLKAFGAKLVLTEGSKGMAGSISKAEEIVASDPNRYVLLQQFKNPANPRIHFETTGPEIWNDTEGAIDILVSGIGTGGTISGVSRYIKNEKGKDSVGGVEPTNSPVITQTLNKQPLKPGPHKIKALGLGFIPDTLDLSMVIESLSSMEDLSMWRVGCPGGIHLVWICAGRCRDCPTPCARRAVQEQDISGGPAGFGERYLDYSLRRRFDKKEAGALVIGVCARCRNGDMH